MKKVLLVSLNQLYPLYSGGALAQYYFIDGLKEKVQFYYCTEIRNETERESLDLLQKKQPGLKIFYHYIPPKPPKSKIYTFIKSIVDFLLNFFSIKSSVPNIKEIEYDDFTDPHFFHVDHHFSNELIILINRIILQESINQIQFDFYDTIDLCWSIPDHVKKIFIHHELRYKRLRLASEHSNQSDIVKKYLYEKTFAYEIMCLKQMDSVVVFNEDDANQLMQFCDNVIVSPFAIPDELVNITQQSMTFDKLLFIGGEGHTPNKLGLIWFLDTIYLANTDIEKLPVYIIGDWSDEVKNKYKNHEKIIFCGIVESVMPYYNQSVLVNPILTGAGLRTKLLHAFANNIPVVSTEFGAEGCFTDLRNDHLIFFANSEDFFLGLKNNDLTLVSKKAYEFYNEFFNKEKLLDIRYRIYN